MSPKMTALRPTNGDPEAAIAVYQAKSFARAESIKGLVTGTIIGVGLILVAQGSSNYLIVCIASLLFNQLVSINNTQKMMDEQAAARSQTK